MNLNDSTTQIILALIGLLAVGGAIISVRKSKKKTVNQNRNNVTNGDIVGGNKTPKS